jgi:hypothetical protein
MQDIECGIQEAKNVDQVLKYHLLRDFMLAIGGEASEDLKLGYLIGFYTAVDIQPDIKEIGNEPGRNIS